MTFKKIYKKRNNSLKRELHIKKQINRKKLLKVSLVGIMIETIGCTKKDKTSYTEIPLKFLNVEDYYKYAIKNI